jgi:hypothetical protein
MKRYVARCHVTDLAVIVAFFESVILPAEGTTISIPCPACREQHDMQVRDPEHFRRAS